jgi:hypothetical protein
MMLSKIVSTVKDKDEDSVSAPFFCKTVVTMMIIGIAARLVLGFFMTYTYDVYHWGVVIQNINSGNGLYELTGYFYTPVWGYFLGLEALFQNLSGIATVGEPVLPDFMAVTTQAFNMPMKLLFLLSDIAVGYLVFWIVRDITKDGEKAAMSFSLWFLCPFVIASGSIMGMFDTISVLMTLLAVVMLRKGRYLGSGVLLCMATLMKLFPGFLMFIFIGYIVSKSRERLTKNLIIFFAGILVTASVMLLPQLLDGTAADAFTFITARTDQRILFDDFGIAVLQQIAGYAAMLVYVLAIAVSVFFAIRIMKNRDKKRTDGLLFDALFVTVTALFVYPPLPHYVLLLLPFMIFAMISDRRYMIPCCLLMIGTTAAILARIPEAFIAVAAYTDIMRIDSLIGVMNWYSAGPIIGYAASAVQYAGILYVLWLRFGKDLLHRRKRCNNDQPFETAQ